MSSMSPTTNILGILRERMVRVSVVKSCIYTEPLHVAAIHAPVMRNKLVLAGPSTRPATRLSRYASELLRELVMTHFC